MIIRLAFATENLKTHTLSFYLHTHSLSSLSCVFPLPHAHSVALSLPVFHTSPSVTTPTPSLPQRLRSLPVELATTLLSTIPPHPQSPSFSLATTLLCPSLHCHISHNLDSPSPFTVFPLTVPILASPTLSIKWTLCVRLSPLCYLASHALRKLSTKPNKNSRVLR
jgi:hypothetical protein